MQSRMNLHKHILNDILGQIGIANATTNKVQELLVIVVPDSFCVFDESHHPNLSEFMITTESGDIAGGCHFSSLRHGLPATQGDENGRRGTFDILTCPYSDRSAMRGSTFVTRRAGM